MIVAGVNPWHLLIYIAIGAIVGLIAAIVSEISS